MNSDWPAAGAWAADLMGRLAHRAHVYEQETDPALRRNKVAAMVGEIAAALASIPGSNSEMLLPLKDLMIFSEDMDNGVRHPWSRPSSAGGTSIESFARTELRRWAVTAVLALRDAGYLPKPAYTLVANMLIKSGRDLSWRGVQGWVRAYENGTDRRLRGVEPLFRTKWSDATCPHGETIAGCKAGVGGRCSSLRQMSEGFASWVATMPHLRDRFEP